MVEKTTCESCGMPMNNIFDHGASDINNPYCMQCTTDNGKLRGREDVRARMLGYHVYLGKSRKEAELAVKEQMDKMPAWKKRTKR